MFTPTFRIPIEALREVAEAMQNDTPTEISDAISRHAEVTGDTPIVRYGVDYKKPEHKQFILDAEDAGYEVGLYHGRSFWAGPCVRLEQGDSGFTTDVPTQQDGMGLGMVVYPKTSDSSLRDVQED